MPKDKDETVMPTPPDPWEVLNRVTAAIEMLALRQQAAPSSTNEELMATLSNALVRLSETQLEGSKLIADETRRAVRPSNEVVPMISVFNRRGQLLPEDAEGPRKPLLKCLMMVPWLLEWESCTREEVELANLMEAGEYTLTLNDKTRVRVVCTIDYKADQVTASRLLITHDTAFNKENFRRIPPLSECFRQYLRQHDPEIKQFAAAVMTDEEEEALIAAGELSVST